MKKIIQIFATVIATILYGQNISDYQYIHVPETFNDVKANKYGLKDLLQANLKQKNYTILSKSKENWPSELLQNPCRVLTAEVTDTSNMFKNRLKIDFKDCKNNTISSLEGKSSVKEFEPGMRDALANAVKNIPVSNPIEQIAIVEKQEPVKNNPPIETQKQDLPVSTTKTAAVSPAPKTEKAELQKAEVYGNGTFTLNKIFLTNGEFILANPNNSVPYAMFKPSTKIDVYHVKLSDGIATLGYLENGKIVVETPNSDGSFMKVVFERK